MAQAAAAGGTRAFGGGANQGGWANSGWAGTRGYGAGGGWGQGGAWPCREFSVDHRLWRGNYSLLDLDARPEGFELWKSQALSLLTSRLPQLGKVLRWAGLQAEPITCHALGL